MRHSVFASGPISVFFVATSKTDEASKTEPYKVKNEGENLTLRFLPFKVRFLTIGLWGRLRSQKTKPLKTEPQKTRVKKSLIDSPHPILEVLFLFFMAI